ncbi:MAG: amino acid synthesis family protein, partial [Ferrovibrio sp.]
MSDLVQVRKIVLVVEELRHDGGPPLAVPVLKGAALAVVRNPYAGRYEPEVQPMMEALKPLGLELSNRLVAALGGVGAIESYGKGVIVGSAGESEHGALWHVPGGYAMRAVLGGARAIVPSAHKLGGLGARLDVPLTHKD